MKRSVELGAEFYLELHKQGAHYPPWYGFHYPPDYYDFLVGLDFMTALKKDGRMVNGTFRLFTLMLREVWQTGMNNSTWYRSPLRSQENRAR
jgi:hypothetical protein